MREVVILYAGPFKSAARVVGGYASANERFTEAISEAGLRVVKMPYYVGGGSFATKLVAYLATFCVLYVRVMVEAFSLRTAKRILHLTGLYKHFIYAELALVALARAFGYKVIYDVRAGSAEDRYASGGIVYRAAFRWTLLLASSVLVEGRECEPFVRSISGKVAEHLPNFVDPKQLCIYEIRDSLPAIRLLYFGRVASDKGVDTCVEVVQHLRRAGLDATLDVIGNLEDPALLPMLSDQGESVRWHGVRSLDFISDVSRNADFFIFPSRHRGEGHSNALTEAMAFGLIPIVSDSGFLRSVCGSEGVVLPRAAGSEAYAQAVLGICSELRVLERKESSRRWVINQFAKGVVVARLVRRYQEV